MLNLLCKKSKGTLICQTSFENQIDVGNRRISFDSFVIINIKTTLI